MTAKSPGEVLFEFTQIGNSVRVSAIDATTGTEVTMQMPANLTQHHMQNMALKKLVYVLGKGKV